MATHPLDVEPLGLGLGEAEAGGVDEEAGDAQQLHGRPDQAGGDDVVDEESAVVWEENAPAPGTRRVRGQWGWRQALPRRSLCLGEQPGTHWNLMSASSRKWVSKSQRKKRSKLGGAEEKLRKKGGRRAMWGASSLHVSSVAEAAPVPQPLGLTCRGEEPSVTPGPYLVSPSEGRMMTMNTRKKKHLCMVS